MIKCTHKLIMMTKGDFKKKEIAAMTVYIVCDTNKPQKEILEEQRKSQRIQSNII